MWFQLYRPLQWLHITKHSVFCILFNLTDIIIYIATYKYSVFVRMYVCMHACITCSVLINTYARLCIVSWFIVVQC